MAISDETVLHFIGDNPNVGREQIRKHAAPKVSDTTIWRTLSRLVESGRLEKSGKGKATTYTIAGPEVVKHHLEIPYNQRLPKQYNKDFLDAYIPNRTYYLTTNERAALLKTGKPTIPVAPAGTYARGILERLLIDLAWASSRMEGNTYNILETEQLIQFGSEAVGKDRKEATMILNHKQAIQYMVDNLETININQQDLFNLHALLSDNLLIDPAMSGRLRALPVQIGHSSYIPLNDAMEIEEEFRIFVAKAQEIHDPFEQSFFLLVHIPYLQAFSDVNKRTSRVASNIPLLKNDLAPMSFYSMDDRAYIDGLIGVYELNNITLLKQQYIAAYTASAENYKIIQVEVTNPDKAGIEYRKEVQSAVRYCVQDLHTYVEEDVTGFLSALGVPDNELKAVTDYVWKQCRGLHAGNAIRFKLTPQELSAFSITKT